MAKIKTYNLPWKRKISYWFITIFMVFLLFSTVEICLRIFLPANEGYTDPYISFKKTMPLFVLDPENAQYRTAANRLVFFRPQSFDAKKADSEFRIFCLGGSTVQGRPYSVETSFTTWLELNLKAADPARQWKVINCGGISYAGYRLVPIMKELLDYQPDMFILCTGHNEFLEDRTYGKIKQTPQAVLTLNRLLLKLRSYRLLHDSVWNRPLPSAEMPEEVTAVLDFEKGLESYHRDDQWHQGVVNHFSHNLELMTRIARDNNIPLILASPPYSLRDCPPFKSQFSVNDTDKQKVLDLWKESVLTDRDDIYGRIRLLEKAAEIEHRHAGLLYSIATLYDRLGRFEDAKKWYLRAKEQDVCPLRILESMRLAIVRIAQKYKVPCIDVQSEFERTSDSGITDSMQLLDHVHPTIRCHQVIAGLLTNEIQKTGLVNLPDGWINRRDESYKQHLSSLNDAYYEKGNARLKRLGEWSRGRIPQPPVLTEEK